MSDEYELSIPDQAVIILCLLGASFVTVCGYVIHRHIDSALFREVSFMDFSPSQQQYMREVRTRNLMAIHWDPDNKMGRDRRPESLDPTVTYTYGSEKL